MSGAVIMCMGTAQVAQVVQCINEIVRTVFPSVSDIRTAFVYVPLDAAGRLLKDGHDDGPFDGVRTHYFGDIAERELVELKVDHLGPMQFALGTVWVGIRMVLPRTHQTPITLTLAYRSGHEHEAVFDRIVHTLTNVRRSEADVYIERRIALLEERASRS